MALHHRPVFADKKGDNLCTMFHSVSCLVSCLVYAESCCLSDRQKGSVLLII